MAGQRVVGGGPGVADSSQVTHVQIDPALEIVERIKLSKLGLAVKFEHRIDLTRDDRADQRPLVGEIVGELRAAYRRSLAQSVHVQRRETVAEDQLGRDLHDPVAGSATLGGQAPVVLRVAMNHSVRLTCLHRRLWDVQPIRLSRVSLGGRKRFGKEGADQAGHLVQRGLQQKVPAVEQMDFGIG